MRRQDGPGRGGQALEPLDRVLAAVVMLVAIATCAGEVPRVIGVVKTSGAMFGLDSLLKLDVLSRVESGDFEATPRLDDLDDVYKSGTGSGAPLHTVAGVPGGVRLSGALDHPRRSDVALQLQLAVLDDAGAAPAVLLPVCGHRAPPSGWRRLGPPPAPGPNDDVLPWDCVASRRPTVPTAPTAPSKE